MFLKPNIANQALTVNQTQQNMAIPFNNKNPMVFDNKKKAQNITTNPNLSQNKIQTNTFNNTVKTQPINDSSKKVRENQPENNLPSNKIENQFTSL